MDETERKQIKPQLLKCAKENENKVTFTGYVIVSSVCRAAVERIEELELELTVEKDQHQEEINLHLHAENYIKSLEQQIEKMRCCGNCNGIIEGGIRTIKCKFCMSSKDLSQWELKNDERRIQESKTRL